MAPVNSSNIENLIRQFALSLEQAMRQEVDVRLQAELRRMSLGAPASSAATSLPRATPQAVQDATGRRVRLCPTPGCDQPAAGPKYGWRCREHGAPYRAKQRGGATAALKVVQPSKASVDAAGRRVRLCPTPGCEKPAAGPKYGWRCREHGASYRAKQKGHDSAPTKGASPAKIAQLSVVDASGRRLRLCPTPGCGKPAAGPKYGWRCREHGAPYRAKQRGSKPVPAQVAQATAPLVVSLPTPRTATVIPEGVQIRRLPPGPTPGDQKRAGPPMDCRLPGCLMKSRGPRYDFFCADHYAQLSAEQRKQYAELWRQSRGGR